jgi:hypothetical protein
MGLNRIDKLLTEIKGMIYRSKSPKMDGSHELDLNKIDKTLNEIHLLNQKESDLKQEMLDMLILSIEDPVKFSWHTHDIKCLIQKAKES